MSEATLTRPPTFMRYQRVEQVLESEPRFKAQMTSKTEAVLKPNGEKQLFAPVVIQVTEAIHATGQDAHKAQKMDIIRVAMEFFRPGRTQPERTETIQAPAAPVARETAPPVPQPAEAPAATAQPPKPKPAAPAKRPAAAAPANSAPIQPKRPVAAKRPVSGGSAKPAEPKSAAPAPEPATAGDTEGHAAPAAPAPRNEAPARPAAARSNDGEETRAPDNRRADAAYNPYISAYTLLLQAAQVIEFYDTQPGKDQRLKTLDELAVTYRKFTGLPRNA